MDYLADGRDCLFNVDAFSKQIPAACFVGWRDAEVLTMLDRKIDRNPGQPASVQTVSRVVTSEARVLPTFVPGFGPFYDYRGRWLNGPSVPLATTLQSVTGLSLSSEHNRRRWRSEGDIGERDA